MGQFIVRTRIAHPGEPNRAVEVDLLVDTGATLSWVPRDVLESLGVPHLQRRSFLRADGGTVERGTAAIFPSESTDNPEILTPSLQFR